MFWKRWPYWLRGGTTGLAVPLVSIVLSGPCNWSFAALGSNPNSPNYICGLLQMPVFPIVYFVAYFGSVIFFVVGIQSSPSLLEVSFGYVVVILIWFLVGVLCSRAFLGRTKSIKKPPPPQN